MEHTCDHMPENARIFEQEGDEQQMFLELSEEDLASTGTKLVKTTKKMQTAIWHCPYCGQSL